MAVHITPHTPLTGEQYGKMGPKYPEGGHCQSVLRYQGSFNVSLFLTNSVETAASFNAMNHSLCCEPRYQSLEEFRPLDGIELNCDPGLGLVWLFGENPKAVA